MKLLESRAPFTFLSVRWFCEEEENGEVVAWEATLCRACREDIWTQHPGARGCGQLGDSCDFCEGRGPRRAVPKAKA